MSLYLALLAAWAALGCAGLLRPTRPALASRLLYPMGALVGLALAVAALLHFGSPPERLVLPIGLPDLPFHLRLDRVVGRVRGSARRRVGRHRRCSRPGYFRGSESTAPGLVCLQYHVFLASHGARAAGGRRVRVHGGLGGDGACLVLSRDHRAPLAPEPAAPDSSTCSSLTWARSRSCCASACCRAAAGSSPSMPCARRSSRPGLAATAAFLLALFGFGAKAGLVPLHVWLPEAHPAAPSPVSALMSGVMLKTAALRRAARCVSICSVRRCGGGGSSRSALGLFTAFYGVVFAAVQTDMKRLLAYSSIENVGIVFTGVGLAIVFAGVGMSALAGARADRGAVSLPQSRGHEEPAVSRHRRSAPRHRRAQPRTARRPACAACPGSPG